MSILDGYTLFVGACVGSFLNVCIHRLPLEESVVRPRSRCPGCRGTIAWYDNIPIVSYLLLRGRCRHCKSGISIEYPIVEGITALLSLLLLRRFGLSWDFLVYAVFTAALIVVTGIDLHHRIIPDEISKPGIVLSLFTPLLLERHTFWDAALGVIVGGGILIVIRWAGTHVFKREAMGFGDVKLLAMIGGVLGYRSILFVLVFSSFLGSIVGLGARFLRNEREIPYGPFLSAAALIDLLWGEEIVRWYLTWITPYP
ncbi:MAG: prepilin peptidase [Deltaproteobacteria bacterium]|nr:MAG: prepilin peptidase [Deltaproteobacteria bacterium]